jgi:hypothetical protein
MWMKDGFLLSKEFQFTWKYTKKFRLQNKFGFPKYFSKKKYIQKHLLFYKHKELIVLD